MPQWIEGSSPSQKDKPALSSKIHTFSKHAHLLKILCRGSVLIAPLPPFLIYLILSHNTAGVNYPSSTFYRNIVTFFRLHISFCSRQLICRHNFLSKYLDECAEMKYTEYARNVCSVHQIKPCTTTTTPTGLYFYALRTDGSPPAGLFPDVLGGVFPYVLSVIQERMVPCHTNFQEWKC